MLYSLKRLRKCGLYDLNKSLKCVHGNEFVLLYVSVLKREICIDQTNHKKQDCLYIKKTNTMILQRTGQPTQSCRRQQNQPVNGGPFCEF